MFDKHRPRRVLYNDDSDQVFIRHAERFEMAIVKADSPQSAQDAFVDRRTRLKQFPPSYAMPELLG